MGNKAILITNESISNFEKIQLEDFIAFTNMII